MFCLFCIVFPKDILGSGGKLTFSWYLCFDATHNRKCCKTSNMFWFNWELPEPDSENTFDSHYSKFTFCVSLKTIFLSGINFPVDQLPVDEKNFQLMKKISSWSGRCAASRNHKKVYLLFFIFKLQTNSQQQNLLSEELPPVFWY